MNKYKEGRMNNKGALDEFASERFNITKKKERFECEKLIGKEFNVSVLYAINERVLSIYRFPTSNIKKYSNKPFLVNFWSIG